MYRVLGEGVDVVLMMENGAAEQQADMGTRCLLLQLVWLDSMFVHFLSIHVAIFAFLLISSVCLSGLFALAK